MLNDANVAEMVVADNRPFCQDVVGTTAGSVSRRIVVAGKQLLFEELMVQLWKMVAAAELESEQLHLKRDFQNLYIWHWNEEVG